MKETIKINLNQRLFDLDADAYNKLKHYLDTLKNYFDKKPDEAEEILQDIEQRIAEILQEKLQEDKQVITLSDIEEVIQKMGTINDFTLEDNTLEEEFRQSENEEAKRGYEDYSRDHRRLHRDLESNIMGGVCSGIAAYFNIDSVWIRLAFVLFFFLNGVGLIIYLILWVIVPAAHTTAQRLQMKGRPVTIENIQESVKSEYEKVKHNLNKYSQSESFRKTRDTANEVFNTFGQLLLTILKIVLIIIGVGCTIVIVAFLIGLIGVLASGGNINTWHFHGLRFNDQIASFFHDITIFSLALITVVLIPIIAILAGIIKMALNIKTRNGILSAFAWTLWSLALVYVIISLISGERIAVNSYRQQHEYKLEINNSKPLYININKNDFSDWQTEYYTFFDKQIIHDKIGDVCYFQPHLNIKSSDNNKSKILIEQTSAIPYFGHDNENDYDYDWKMQDTLLLLNNYFSIDEEMVWLIPDMIITVYVPEGQKVVMEQKLDRLLFPRYNREEEYSYDDYNTLLVMKNGELVECDN